VLNVAKYKTYIIIGAVCFALGYCLSLLSSRGQLQAVRIRADEYQKRLTTYQAGEAKFDNRLKQFQVELAASRNAAEKYRKEVSRLRTEINNLSKPISEAGSGIDGAIDHTTGIEGSVNRIERILSAVQKRGQIKDP
jgi:predicted  nucleic acid-binding Zn-ribbon protein